MLGALKIGCAGVLLSLCGIGFALSSSIQRHMIESYQHMTNEVETAAAKLTADTAQMVTDSSDASVVGRITAERRAAADQYNLVLAAQVFGVMLVITVMVYLLIRRYLDRHLQSIQARLDALKAEEARLRQPQNPYSSPSSARWGNVERQGCTRFNRYKVDSQ
jgi:hypothetical protein